LGGFFFFWSRGGGEREVFLVLGKCVSGVLWDVRIEKMGGAFGYIWRIEERE
jgi:hypothetical protein